MNKSYKIEGMTCASCTQLIEKEATKLKAIKTINVSFATEVAALEVEADFSELDFKSLLENLGYRIKLEAEEFVDRTLRHSGILLAIGSLFMGLMFLPIDIMKFHTAINASEIVICSLLIFFLGKSYFYNLNRFVRYMYADMHTLIALGIFSSLIYSIILFFTNPHSHLYVESIPFIMGFTLLGKYFEKKAKTKALSSFGSLYKGQIKFCKKVTNIGIENIPVIDIKLGDVIRILPGEKIPLNGVVIKGSSHLDESFINGESRPIYIEKNAKVLAGAINLDGSIDLAVESLFQDTSVAEIIKKLEEVEKNKSKVEVISEKIVAKFVPVIILISLLTLAVHLFLGAGLFNSMKYFLAVLVIACPCALGLASPMGVVLSTRKAFDKGILINGGDVLFASTQIDTVVFDKTGTLTMGKPAVREFKILAEDNKENLLQIIGSLTSLSSHPLSLAITEFCQNKKVSFIDPDKFKNIPGQGMMGEVRGKKVYIGNKKLLLENQIEVNEFDAAESMVFIAFDNKLIGYFKIVDQVKPEAIGVIQELKKQNKEVWMLTGDHLEVAQKIASELQIENFKSGVSPVEKSQFIEDLKKQGKKVAMLGDGINDSIALSSADVSMAMSNGSDIAVSVGSVSIDNGNLNLVLDFFKISKKGMNIIYQNLFFSFLYNLLCIPMAAGILQYELDPKWASLSMGLSSVSVILNSMRIKKD